MQVDIQARSFTLTKALKSYVEKKLKTALPNRGEDHRLKRAVIRLSDINGPKGGEDKLCHIEVMLVGVPDVVIRNTEQDMYAAIDVATRRASHAVVRRLERQRRRLKVRDPMLNQQALA